MRRNNCQEYDPEMKTDYLRRNKTKQEAIERAVDETVEKTISAMPGEKRERLQNELNDDLDLITIRTTSKYKPIKTRVDHGRET